MSGEPKKKDGNEETRAWQAEDTRGDVSVPAIRHVGPTLESDPEYLELVGSGGPTLEAQIAEGVTAVPGVSDMVEENFDPLSGRGEAAERLKTRLPGDTSSDPHTDVGPDNATTVQRRGEGKERAA